MGNGLVLKFKGNKSFVAFSNLGDAEALTKTWKVCTKVAAHLEQGQRLENLSWRLWHLQNLMVESDNAKSKREFRKLSKHMGEKLDKEKGRSIEELSAPRFHRNQSSDKVRRLAEEKERIRENHHNSSGHRLNRMQFTFSVDAPHKAEPHIKPSQARRPEPKDNNSKETSTKKSAKGKASKPKGRDSSSAESDVQMDTSPTFEREPVSDRATQFLSDVFSNANTMTSNADQTMQSGTLRFPTLFSDDFAPTALLYPSPNFAPSLSYGEGVGSRNSFGVTRPTILLPLDELLANTSSPEDSWAFGINQSLANTTIKEEDLHSMEGFTSGDPASFMSAIPPPVPEIDRAKTPKQQTVAPNVNAAATTINNDSKPTAQPALSVSTKNLPVSRGRRSSTAAARGMLTSSASAPSSAASSNRTSAAPTNTPITPTNVNANGKSECVNCGATHTPLWRRGLNDELNCNACGLYCKLHKRPRPKTMRQQNAESGRPNGNQRADLAESMGEPGTKQRKSLKRSPHQSRGAARCVNCHTMATPLWRKDDEGKTVCNACGLYFKLHNSNRPISMKSDVIRKRSRADQRRAFGANSETPSASPSVSRATSPEREGTPPTAATPPESAQPAAEPVQQPQGPNPFDPTQAAFNFPADEFDFPSTASPQLSQSDLNAMNVNEMMGLGFPIQTPQGTYNAQYSSHYSAYTDFEGSFPGPFHPDYLRSLGVNIRDTMMHERDGDTSEIEKPEQPADRGNKRRRLSTESYQSSISATDPPSSTSSLFPLDNSSSASFSSIGLPAHSAKSNHNRTVSDHDSEIPTGRSDRNEGVDEDFPMDFLHPPMLIDHERDIMAALLHPPLVSDGPSGNNMHPPMLPYLDYSGGNTRNGGSNSDFMDVSTLGLFNTRF